MKKIEAIIRTTKFEDVKLQLEQIRIDFFSQQSLSGIEKSLLYRFQNQHGKVNDAPVIPIDYSLLLN